MKSILNEDPNRAIDKYYLYSQIGKGQFGEVFVSCSRDTSQKIKSG